MEIGTIHKRMAQIEQLEQENRASKEMLNSELESDPLYLQVAEEAKAAATKKKRMKDEIFTKGPNQKLVAEVKNNVEEITTLKEILSSELVQLYQEQKRDEIEDHHGHRRKIKVLVKLLPQGAE